tara:strand:+ start:918 stop:2600 length:1683 start_codon:yes stop_codon:yes gene_type:complete
MGILRADRITGLGGANAIKGSVKFTSGGALDINLDGATIGTSNFTIEAWVFWFGGYYHQITGTESNNFNFYINNDDGDLVFYDGSSSFDLSASNIKPNEWTHIALVREGTSTNQTKVYINGTNTQNITVPTNFSFARLATGTNYFGGSVNYGNGYQSNLRFTLDAVYTSAFTPPNHELTVLDNTIVLCCQSPGNILQDATGKTITPFKHTLNSADAVASHFTPNSPVGFSTTTDVGSQYGTTFDGFTTFATSTYMVPPGGNTRERNRGRGLFAGGDAPIGFDISSIEIQSLGNAADFGDLTQGRLGTGSVGSSTRGLISSGYTQPANANVATIDFVTIANTSNATTFGDSTQARHELGASSSETRAIFGGGTSPSLVDTIDFVTIATAGDATDFGNLTVSRRNVTGVSSPTRSVFLGGRTSGDTASDVLDFVTIASTGNATDFGNLTVARGRGSSVCSSTRGVMCGGETPTAVNTIDFITIASAGNATDFGDCITTKRDSAGGASNKTRGAFLITYVAPAYTNAIQFITIATTGNSADFGDNTVANGRPYGFSDSHGGLS